MTDIEAIKRAVALIDDLWTEIVNCSENPGIEERVALKRGESVDIAAALSALAPVAEGKAVIVPVEPTPEMRHAFHAAHEKCLEGGLDGDGNEMWSPDFEWAAMIGARG